MYHVAGCLHLSLGSVLAQTFNDIEIILVDDASTDDTVDVARSLIQDDPRAHIYTHETNRGPAAARNTGLEYAKGEYCLFVDADDELSLDACAVLMQEIGENPVDILHFPLEFEIHGEFKESDAEHMKRFFVPMNKDLSGWQIVESAFLFYEHSWNQPGKLIRTSLCKHALEMMPETDILLGEDILFYFFVASEAKSYKGIAKRNLYKYRYGLGGSTRKSIDLDQFTKRWIKSPEVAKYLICAYKDKETPPSFNRIIASISNHLLGETMDAVLSLLPEEERYTALSQVQKAWSAHELVSFMSQIAWGDTRFGRRLFACDKWNDLACNGHDKLVCYSASCMAEEIPSLVKEAEKYGSGKTATLILEEPLAFNTQSFENCEVVLLSPRLPCINAASYKSRAKVLEEYLVENQIGQVVFLNYYDYLFFWDVTLLTLLGVKVVDAKGADLRKCLYSDKLLEEATKEGLPGERLYVLTEDDHLREHLGYEYALRSYKRQAIWYKQEALANHRVLRRALVGPYRFVKRLLR